MTNKGLVY